MVCVVQVLSSLFNVFGWEYNAWLRADHPTLPVFSPQISPPNHLELGRLWLSIQSHTNDHCFQPNNQRYQDTNPLPQDFKSGALITRLGWPKRISHRRKRVWKYQKNTHKKSFYLQTCKKVIKENINNNNNNKIIKRI